MKLIHLYNTRYRFRFKWQLMGLVFALLFTGQIFAQYELKKHSINSGGAVMTADGYELKASLAQVDASQPSSGGNYQLNSGFWPPNKDLIFKNKF